MVLVGRFCVLSRDIIDMAFPERHVYLRHSLLKQQMKLVSSCLSILSNRNKRSKPTSTKIRQNSVSHQMSKSTSERQTDLLPISTFGFRNNRETVCKNKARTRARARTVCKAFPSDFGGNALRGMYLSGVHSMQSFGGPFHSKIA